MKTFLFFTSLLLLKCSICAFGINSKTLKTLHLSQVWADKTYKSTIKTILIYIKGSELAFPIINLEKDEKIVLTFDEMATKKVDYSYALIHCNANWEQDDLEPIEFLSGYENGYIATIASSQNTITNYTNYTLEIPEKDCKILKSGNYLVKVFERNDDEKLVLTRRFYVIEPNAEVTAKVDQLRVNTTDGLNQRVNLEIKYNQIEITDLSNFFTIKIFENLGLEKTFNNLKPTGISGNILKYENLSGLCFAGGMEFRHFDIKSIKFLSDRLINIEKNQNGNQVFLTPDENRSKDDYNFKNDLNGRKLIKLENSDRSNIMADYCNVYFELKSEIPVEYGDYYIFGAISDWQFEDQFKMKYDYAQKKYTSALFLKQGYYNYLYIFKTSDNLYNSYDYLYKAEGNHFQTENEYTILVYYNDKSAGFDRLISYNSVNSTNSGQY